MTFFIKGVRRAVPPMIDGVEDSSSFVVAMAILSMVNISLSHRSPSNCSSIVLRHPSVFLLLHLVDLSDGHGHTLASTRSFTGIARVLRRIPSCLHSIL